MKIEVGLFMQFRKYLPVGAKENKAIVSLKEKATVDDLLNTLGIPEKEQKLLVINGVSQDTSGEGNYQALKDKDVVLIFPPVGGG
jgi:molybdopterin converting factor small subunit